MTDNPGQHNQPASDDSTIDAHAGNYDESGYGVAMPGEDSGDVVDSDRLSQPAGEQVALDDRIDDSA